MRPTQSRLFAILVLAALVPPESIFAGRDCETHSLRPERVEVEAVPPIDFLLALDFERRIESSTRVVEVVAAVRGWMADFFELRIEKPVVVRVCQRFSGLGGGEDRESPTLGFFKATPEESIVALAGGMKTRRLLQVAAHELVHAWQAENCPEGQRLEIYEGFAQWTAGELLKAVGLEDDFRVLAEREDFYGESYRWIAAIEEKGGWEALIRYVRTAP